MLSVTAERQPKERYACTEIIQEMSWRRRKDGEDFRKNRSCLGQDGETPFSEPRQDKGQCVEGLTGLELTPVISITGCPGLAMTGRNMWLCREQDWKSACAVGSSGYMSSCRSLRLF